MKETESARLPQCGGMSFRRASLFSASVREFDPALKSNGPPPWLAEARDALVRSADYLAYADGERAVPVAPFERAGTRIGRSLSADLRLDDPTCRAATRWSTATRRAPGSWMTAASTACSERRAGGAHGTSDGDEVAIGRFRLYFLSVAGERVGSAPADLHTASSR